MAGKKDVKSTRIRSTKQALCAEINGYKQKVSMLERELEKAKSDHKEDLKALEKAHDQEIKKIKKTIEEVQKRDGAWEKALSEVRAERDAARAEANRWERFISLVEKLLDSKESETTYHIAIPRGPELQTRQANG